MAKRNTILLKDYLHVRVELTANAAITPGMLIERMSTNKVRAHATPGGNVFPMFALEDNYQGKTVNDAYAEDYPVQCWIPQRGDEVYALLDDGENVAIGDFVESAGNGSLQKHTADTVHSAGIFGNQIIGVVIEALDLSSSSGTYPETGKRVIIQIL